MPRIISGNLYQDLPPRQPEEDFQTLRQSRRLRIERIVSQGHASPEGFWYDQEQEEFVALLHGAARLCFEQQNEPVELKSGDWLIIPAHVRHRVEWTDPNEPTVWLAAHYD
ncbi:cupin domain-containing protein [Candidatus Sumerlaeota bacterium]|nr:cupin domain-containing protein [Candidatus Sumerlaeota bacterium]